MKAKISIAAVIILLILAQFIFGGGSGGKAGNGVKAAAAPAAPGVLELSSANASCRYGGPDVAGMDADPKDTPETPDTPDASVKGAGELSGLAGITPAAANNAEAGTEIAAEGGEPLPAPLFAIQAITGIDLPGDGGRLRHTGPEGWKISAPGHAASEPADAEKIRRLLADLSLAGARASLSHASTPQTGLEDGGGLTLALREGESGPVRYFRIGLRPEGAYDAAYLVLPDGKKVLAPADIRGDLGLFVNRPGALPPKDFWLDRVVLSFDAAAAVRLSVQYPDHKLVFAKNPDGEWQPESPVPDEAWSRPGLAAWLRDLAAFRVDGQTGGEAGLFPEDAKTCKIIVTLADGSVKTLLAGYGPVDAEVQVLTSERPESVFRLSAWRYRKYFRRLEQLFPKAAAHYDLSDIRFIDLRRDGESVKIAYRDGEWRGVAVPYRVRSERLERLARFLAGWRPEDYAASDFRLVRPGYGGPMLEVILADGEVHQYRLAGRHPFLPWRYVIQDGKTTFSVTEAAAGLMFPGFAEVLDLGLVFAPITRETVTRIELADAGQARITFEKDGTGAWKARTEAGETAVSEEEGRELLDEFMLWPVLGFYENNQALTKTEPAFTLCLWDEAGGMKKLSILPPHEREIPYLTDSGRAFLFDRAEFFNWLGAVRGVSKRILSGEPEKGGGEAETLNAGERL